jgi:ApbE superfamily uncharacterized protein (UPF0280 family)
MVSPRTYRRWVQDKDLVSFVVTVKESDLYIRANKNLQRKALRILQKVRLPLEKYIVSHPDFATALEAFPVEEDAPRIVKTMAEATAKVGVGPMAAVAGAVAEMVGMELLDFSPDVIVENGGDIFIKSSSTRLVGIFAAESPFTGRLAIELSPENTPLGICTSSGTVGHSLSFGKADAVIIISKSTSLADAAATAIGNLIQGAEDIEKGLDLAKSIAGLKGVLLIVGDKLGVWGEVRLKEIN